MTFASKQINDVDPGAGSAVPLPDYPRPQMTRARWMNLNGWWDFAVAADDEDTVSAFPDRILVPFAPESTRSGIGRTDFMERVRYRRTISLPADWRGEHVLLHVQACDHDTTVLLDGTVVGRHRGGFSTFTIDLGAIEGDHELVIRADDSRTEVQARGKQSRRPENYEAFYTRTTGIWQTVWLEPVPATRLGRPRITPRVHDGALDIGVPVVRPVAGLSLQVSVFDDRGRVSRATAAVDQTVPAVRVVLPEDRVRLWSPEDPFLYDLEIALVRDGRTVDAVTSYAGLRSVTIEGAAVLVNGRPRFQRLVLDQGWYPDTLMTAPDDDALVRDIRLAQEAGFNGARLHQKVFDERFLYHADRLGYLVWGEFGDWGANLDERIGRQEPTAAFIGEWLEVLERDHSHPSIVGWCPLNETFQPMSERLTVLDDVTAALYRATKLADPTRPVLDTSGYAHRVQGADVYDSHLYEQDPVAFTAAMRGLANGRPYVNRAEDGTDWSVGWAGQPYFCSEFGGIWWSDSEDAGVGSWGYGTAPRTREAWLQRFRGMVDALLDDPLMFGYCFTQLTDVFQEQNGVLRFDRSPKFDLAQLHAIQTRLAAIESPALIPHQSKETESR